MIFDVLTQQNLHIDNISETRSELAALCIAHFVICDENNSNTSGRGLAMASTWCTLQHLPDVKLTWCLACTAVLSCSDDSLHNIALAGKLYA